MRKYLRRNFLKVTIISSVLLLIMLALTLHVTISASKTTQELETANESLHSDSNFELQDGRIKRVIESPVFAEFDIWVKQYLDGDFSGNREQLKRGENLAVERRELLKELIRLAPKTALEYAISEETKNRLPASIAENLERRLSAYGDLLVYVLDEIDPSTGNMRGSRTEREAVFGDLRYKAFVYGRRETMTTKLNIPLQGIVLDGIMAVDENPLRKLATSEFASRDVDSAELGQYGVAVEEGGSLKYFSSQSELDAYIEDLIQWESKIGPARRNVNLSAGEIDSTWTEGAKTILFIRVDFPDRPGEPIDSAGIPLTITRAQNLMNNEVSPFYVANSYNKTSLQTTVIPLVVRLPQAQTFYTQGNNYNLMRTDAQNAARAIGFETNNFNLEIIAFSHTTSYTWAGLGAVGGKGTWLNGAFNLRVTAHELGHNYGLGHANLWRTTDGTVIGQGSNVEYGDCFDAMGACNASQSSHFNTRYKRTLDWLTDANVQTVTNNGVYRIFAQDSLSPGGIRTLKIRKNAAKNYWVEFRQLFTSNPNAMNGAILRWDYLSGQRWDTQLLDLTPNTSTNVNDAPLLIGQSFNDNENRIRITVLGKGNTIPESLDVQVELNVGCTFSLGQTSQSFSASGGEGSIAITTQNGCFQNLASSNDWLTPTFVLTGSETITQYFIVAANYTSQPRTGTFSVDGQTFTVQQSAATTACAQQPPNLIAWWRGEGNGLDQTGSNNGNVLGGMSYGAGKIGGGFKGNVTNSASNNKIIVPDSPSLALDRSLAIEGWLRFDSVANYSILVRADDRDFAGSYGIFLFDGKLWFRIIAAPNGTSAVVVSPNALPTNQFVHFGATLDDATGKMSMYINGSLVTQRDTTVRPYSVLDPTKNPGIAIGNLKHSSLSYASFNGVIDELSIYNRSLNASEMQAIYNAGIATTGATAKCLSAQTQRKQFDFDGDGKSDISVFRPSNGMWYLQQSLNGFTGVAFGANGDLITPADYDGDGKTDIAVFRPSNGVWYLQRSQLGFTGISFGASGDVPMPADYDNDGKTDLAVFRPSNGVWYIQQSTAGFIGVAFGANGDVPVAADYDGDGKADVSVFRPSNGVWYLNRSQLGFTGIAFGANGDKPVPADYDGDNKADVAVFRPSNGVWYLLQSQAGFKGVAFGAGTDLPVVADYDGDGKSDVAVFRPSNGVWYLQQSTQGFTGAAFGANGDKPIPNAFVP